MIRENNTQIIKIISFILAAFLIINISLSLSLAKEKKTPQNKTKVIQQFNGGAKYKPEKSSKPSSKPTTNKPTTKNKNKKTKPKNNKNKDTKKNKAKTKNKNKKNKGKSSSSKKSPPPKIGESIANSLGAFYGLVLGIETALMVVCVAACLLAAMVNADQQKSARYLDYVKKAVMAWIALMFITTIISFAINLVGDDSSIFDNVQWK